MALSNTHTGVRRFRFSSLDGKEDEVPPPVEVVKKQEPAPLPGPIPLPLQLPAITEKDLQNARTEAQAAGYREGYAAAQAKFDKEAGAREDAVKSLLEIIANRITLAAESHENSLKEREGLMAKLVMAASRKIAGDALKREPYAGVESLLKECVAMIAGKPKVTVVVSNVLAAGLKQRIDTLKPMLQGFTGTLTVEEDAGLLDQDCRVEWESGFGGRTAEELWKQIEAIVARTSV
jgi:flagellar assembly protein FliH